jgi:hypothetical protein
MLCGPIVVTGSSKMLELGTFWEGTITTQCVSSCHQVVKWFGISLPLGMAKGTCRWSLCLTKKIITKGRIETSRTENSKCQRGIQLLTSINNEFHAIHVNARRIVNKNFLGS